MKDYLNKDERVQLLFLKKYVETAEKIKEWEQRNNLSKEERKALNMSITWGAKVFNSIYHRLNEAAAKTFLNSMKDAYINVQDKYAVDIYKRRMKSSLNDCYEENKEYYKLVELLMHYNCRNCKRHCSQCEIYKEFEERCIPEPTGQDNGKCRYAYEDK